MSCFEDDCRLCIYYSDGYKGCGISDEELEEKKEQYLNCYSFNLGGIKK